MIEKSVDKIEHEKTEVAVATEDCSTPQPDAPLSPERTAVLSDLHWLVHQGHIIEYANGQMEIAPKPQQPQQKKKNSKLEKEPKKEKPMTAEASVQAKG